jgi:hypothetical protein
MEALMEIICILAICMLLGIASKKLSDIFLKLSNDIAERDREERFYREALLSALRESENNSGVENQTDPIEGLLRANQELTEKRQIQEAIEKELGIEML